MSEILRSLASSSLVQHEEKFRVCQHGAGRVALEQIGHILGDAHAACVILPHPLPEREQEVCTILMLEKQVYLVHIDEGSAPLGSVADDPVEYGIQYHQHPHGQELLAKVTDIVTEDAAVGVHIGGLCEGVQTALGKKLDCQSHIRSLRLRLAQEFRVEILEGGNIATVAAANIV